MSSSFIRMQCSQKGYRLPSQKIAPSTDIRCHCPPLQLIARGGLHRKIALFRPLHLVHLSPLQGHGYASEVPDRSYL